MRQFAGFGSARDTNRRFHYLLGQGMNGLSVAFDNPTLMGVDSDHALSVGEVGRTGVAIDSLADMEVLFEGIPLDRVSTSMTINAPAAVLLAMYVAVGEKQGVPSEKLTGTLQNDILKEYIAQKEWIYPPKAGVKLIVDTVHFTMQHMPKYNPISIRNRPMPTAKLCFMLREIDCASQPRNRSSVSTRKRTPLTKTAPSRCCQVIASPPIVRAVRPKAMKAFSPMYGATAMGRLA